MIIVFPSLKKLLTAQPLKAQYPGLEMNEGQMLVNVPKGYDKENPAAPFLKLKSFVATKNIPDTLLTSPALTKEVTLAFKALMPLVKFMNRSME